MRKLTRLLPIVMFAVLSLPALAATPKPSSAPFIPVYPGAKPQMQINLTDKDFIPMIRQWVSMLPGMVTVQGSGGTDAGMFGESSIKELQTALGGLKRVAVASFALPAKVRGDSVVAFYTIKLGLGTGWTENLTMNTQKGIVRVFTKPGMDDLFGMVTGTSDILVFRTKGHLDLVAISKWLQGAWQMMQQNAAQETPATPVEPAPAPAAPEQSQPAK